MSKSRIFACKECNAVAMLIQGGNEELTCGGKPMEALTANTTDAAKEKHVPVATVEGNRVSVKVGSAAHPMTETHLIQWIYLQTKRGGQYRYLSHTDAPEAGFIVADGDSPVAVYGYCNLHGLWKADI